MEKNTVDIYDSIPFNDRLLFVFLVTKNVAYVEYQNNKLVHTQPKPDLIGYNAVKVFASKEDAIKFAEENAKSELTNYCVTNTTYSIRRVNIEDPIAVPVEIAPKPKLLKLG